MLIYRLALNSHTVDPLLTGAGMEVRLVPPSRLSFVTSIRMAAEVKHRRPDLVVCSRVEDAIGTLSARKLSDGTKSPYPIVLFVSSTLAMPRRIPGREAEAIDAIVFESPETRERWKQVGNLDKIKIIDVIPLPAEPLATEPRKAEGQRIIGYIGPISDAGAVGRFVRKMVTLGEEQCPPLEVVGTAPARYISPVIRLAKANRLPVTWHGDDYKMADILSRIDGFVPSGDALSEIEKQALALGIPAVTDLNIDEWLAGEQREKMSAQAIEQYNSEYAPQVFISRVKALKDRLV